MADFVNLHRIDWIRFKAVAEDYFRRGRHYEETYMEMKDTYEGICPEKNTIYKWEKSFRASGNIVHFTNSSGRPRLYGLAGKILPLIEMDRSISLRRLADLLGSSREAIAKSIELDLLLHSVSLRWIPHKLSE
jgi:transposase